MSKSKLIACFQDTVNLSHSNLVLEATKKAQKSNKVYKEGFAIWVETFSMNADIIVEDNTSFAVAQKYQQYGRVRLSWQDCVQH